MRYDYQIYGILETVASLDQQVVINLLSTLTQSLKDSERKWGFGRNIAQRYVWIIWLHFLGSGYKNLDLFSGDRLFSHS